MKAKTSDNKIKIQRFWLAVASREHVLRGVAQGFAQFCHGKLAPARRVSQGDGLIYYSSKETYSPKQLCQKFTAIGFIANEAPYQVEMAPGFCPYRRDVRYVKSHEAEIRQLIIRLEFIKDKIHWGKEMRFGFLEIPGKDFDLIASAMAVKS